MPVLADLIPPELTAIRVVGLALAVVVAGFAIWRRRQLRNADVLILLVIALGLAIVSGTQILDTILSAFSFERENGTRIVGVVVFAGLIPPELTAIRVAGLALAVAVAGFAIWRRRQLRNADVLILLVIALGLAIVSGTEILDTILSAFSFERENGTRIVGVVVFAVLI